VVKNRIVDWGRKPFKCFDAWEEIDGYKEEVRHAWAINMDCENDLERVKLKLKNLKQALQKWRELVFNKEKETTIFFIFFMKLKN